MCYVYNLCRIKITGVIIHSELRSRVAQSFNFFTPIYIRTSIASVLSPIPHVLQTSQNVEIDHTCIMTPDTPLNVSVYVCNMYKVAVNY